MNKLITKIFPPLFIIIFNLILFKDVLIVPPGKIIYGGDLLTQFYFWKGYFVHSLQKGIIPFWNPYLFSGTPFLAHPSTAAFYPPNWLFLLLPLNLAFSLIYFLHLCWGGIGFYLLAGRYTEKVSAAFASLLFSFSGFLAARIYAGHYDLFTTAVWIPWVMWSFLNLWGKGGKKTFLVSVILLTFQILAGFLPYVIFTLEFISLYIFLNLFLSVGKTNVRDVLTNISRVSLSITVAILIASVQWIPTWELTQNSIRGEGLPYSLASWGSLPLTGIKLLLNPSDPVELSKLQYGLTGGKLPNSFDHYIGFLSVITVLGILIYKLVRRKSIITGDVWIFHVISLFFLLVSFGPNLIPNIHYFLYKFFPFYSHFRIPAQHLVIPAVLIPLSAVIMLGGLKRKLIRYILLGLMAIELFTFSQKYYYLVDEPGRNTDKSLIQTIKNNIGDGRFLPAYRIISPVLAELEMNQTLMYRIPSTSGYDPVILKNYYDYINRNGRQLADSLVYYNVELVPFIPDSGILEDLNVSLVNAEKGKIQNVSQLEPILETKESTLFKLKDKVKSGTKITPVDPNCDDKNTSLQPIYLSLNKNIYQYSGQCDSYVTFSDIYYPGWQAKSDNKSIDITQNNQAFRGIKLPKGRHILEIYYFPKIYFLGALVSIFGLIVFVYGYKRNSFFGNGK